MIYDELEDIREEEEYVCTDCGSTNVQVSRDMYDEVHGESVYECKGCGSTQTQKI